MIDLIFGRRQSRNEITDRLNKDLVVKQYQAICEQEAAGGAESLQRVIDGEAPPVIISKALYEYAKREGYDMRPYAISQPIPLTHEGSGGIWRNPGDETGF